MSDREKLVELLTEFYGCDPMYYGDDALAIAQHLVDRGVTVPQWISVDDRLPDENTTVIAATDNGIVFQCLYAYDGWDLWDGNEVNITHWQQMPQPPKGE